MDSVKHERSEYDEAKKRENDHSQLHSSSVVPRPCKRGPSKTSDLELREQRSAGSGARSSSSIVVSFT